MVAPLRRGAFAALILTAASIATPAQRVDPFRLHLPPNRTLDASRSWARTDLPKAMRTMLNSEGDALTLRLNGAVTGGIFVNGGAKIDFDCHLARGRDGRTWYQISVDADVAATAGVELAQGIEGNAALGGGGATVYRFSSLTAACRGVDALIVATANDSIVGGPFIQHRKKLVCSAQKTVRLAEKALRSLRKATPKALRNRGAYKRAYRKLARRISSAQRRLRDANSLLGAYNRFTTSVARSRAHLNRHRHCAQFRLTLSGSAEASLGVPGLTLEGCGAGAGLEIAATGAVRVFPKQGATQTFEVVRSLDATVELWAALVVGGDLVQQHGIELLDVVELRNGRYARTLEQSMTLTADTAIHGSVGVGVAGKYGVGRTLAVVIDRREMRNVSQAFLRGFLSARSTADFDRMILAAGSLPVAFSLQDRWDVGLKMKFGVSAAGNGWEIGGTTFWHDAGVDNRERLTIREAMARLKAAVVGQLDAAATNMRRVLRRSGAHQVQGTAERQSAGIVGVGG